LALPLPTISPPKIISGRFHATIVGYRHATFRSFGAWRASC
jgi:hypothetical protein